MKKAMQIVLGVVTGIGGFLEVGSIATAAEAGASFRYKLIWAIALGTVCLIFLIEMTGRLAAVSKHTIADAVRERFGFKFAIVPRGAELIVNLLVIASEIGGVALALKFITGIEVRVWAIPIALLLWLTIWAGTLDFIEDSTALLGLVSIAFVVAALKMHPDYHAVLHGLLPSAPRQDAAHYWYIAAGILGATISPYMFHFYGSGAIEDKWGEDSLGANRITAGLGMSFGAVMSVAVLVSAALVLAPRGIEVARYEQAALILIPALGRWGLPLFAATLGICCFGAAIEVSLATAYMLAQTLGWNWGANKKPDREARFSMTYVIMLLLGGSLLLTGIDPLKLTMFAMAITAVILPLIVMPFMLLLNDKTYVHEHTNGPIGNTVVMVTLILASVVAIITIPLEIAGGG
ncbi:MAG TPA: divalent metal cation transporter [Thermoanaerobaculia bacterium]|jgi:NRAMP (natural resistance-associated macrophage protein)-like metal ion transporter|nr:divalent metal cation transporter [Thermoanaerobaculia bacterium]